MRSQAATCLFESTRRAEATAFRSRPSLKERNVDLSFYEPLYASFALAYNHIIQRSTIVARDVSRRDFLRASAMGLEDFVRGRFGEGRGLTAFGTRGDAS